MKKPYNAFISYSHAEDSKIAAAVHSGLHRFAKPWYRLRALHIFRDKTSMSANPALWPAIEQALKQSEWLLFFASPTAAKSEWVQRELRWWLTHRSVERLIICVTDGELIWNNKGNDFDWEKTTSLPSSFHGTFKEEPLWVDLRNLKDASPLSLKNPAFRDCILNIAAPLHGKPKDSLYSDDLREHRKLRAASVGALLAILLLTFVVHRVDEISRERKDTITSLDLASKSYLLLATDPELSALLALAGYARQQTGQTEVALRHALAKLAGQPPARLLDTGGNIRAIALSEDGSTILSATNDGPLALWQFDDAKLLATLQPAIAGDIASLAWGSQGAIVASDSAGIIHHWKNANTPGEALHADSAGKALQIAFTSDGNEFAIAYDNGAISFYSAATAQVSGRIQAHTAAVTAIAFHQNGQVIASGSSDGSIRLWNIRSGTRLAELTMAGPVKALTFNPAGKTILSDELLVAGDETGELRVADVQPVVQGTPADRLRWFPLDSGESIIGAQFTRNGKCLLAGSNNGNLQLRQINAWQTLVNLSDGDNQMIAATAGGSTRFAALLASGQAVLYETAMCASVDELCAFGIAVLKRSLTEDDRLRFIAGKKASSADDPLPAQCQALVDNRLGGQR